MTPPPSGIDEIIADYEAALADGRLVGSGPGGSAPNRPKALNNMLFAAKAAIDAGDTQGACEQLESILKRIGPTSADDAAPDNFVVGEDADSFRGQVEALQAELCL
jgi:hypothetical protein